MKIGLVLEGGGIKGSYQIGAYKALKEKNIKFNGFVGTSIGSFNAAFLASEMDKELYEFWTTVDPGIWIDADKRLIEAVQSNSFNIKLLLQGSLSSMKKWILGRGIPIDYISEEVNKLIDFNKILKSNYDYGLVTVRQKDFKPFYINKEDIIPEKFNEYIMASCYLPVFKRKKIIDDNYYMDGGFYDNAPVSMLLEKNYDKIYIICNNALGIRQLVSKKDQKKITKITPSRNICALLEMDRSKILENIKLGYYDTLRVIKNYDGYTYTFKKTPEFFFKALTRKISSRKYQRIESFFNANSIKETVIKALEYVAQKEEIDYYNIYNFYKLLKEIQKQKYEKHFIYDFVKELKIF